MRITFLSLLLISSSAGLFGQNCSDTCPAITCSGDAQPVCTESGYWVCPCGSSQDGAALSTCYQTSDCSEGYSCTDSCCVSTAGCAGGACLSASDCGSDSSEWSCTDNCCVAGGGGCAPPYSADYASALWCSCALASDCQSGYCYAGECNPQGNGGGGGGGGQCQSDADCPGCQGCNNSGECYDDDSYCSDAQECIDGGCEPIPPPDPIAIDLDGSTFPMTDLREGVQFDFYGTGEKQQVSWTAASSKVGWLVLDLNHNGRIDDGFEMFSNIAKQRGLGSSASIGFRALAEYDQEANGGNADGVINAGDRVFSRLRLWVDANHDGVSQPAELLTMQQAGIESISLAYEPLNWTDAYGNQFRSRATVTRSGSGSGTGQWAYDVVLVNAKEQ